MFDSKYKKAKAKAYKNLDARIRETLKLDENSFGVLVDTLCEVRGYNKTRAKVSDIETMMFQHNVFVLHLMDESGPNFKSIHKNVMKIINVDKAVEIYFLLLTIAFVSIKQVIDNTNNDDAKYMYSLASNGFVDGYRSALANSGKSFCREADYGKSANSPVFVESPLKARQFLANLKKNDCDRDIIWTRIGSCDSETVEGMVDIYSGTIDNEEIDRVYICRYSLESEEEFISGYNGKEFYVISDLDQPEGYVHTDWHFDIEHTCDRVLIYDELYRMGVEHGVFTSPQITMESYICMDDVLVFAKVVAERLYELTMEGITWFSQEELREWLVLCSYEGIYVSYSWLFMEERLPERVNLPCITDSIAVGDLKSKTLKLIGLAFNMEKCGELSDFLYEATNIVLSEAERCKDNINYQEQIIHCGEAMYYLGIVYSMEMTGYVPEKDPIVIKGLETVHETENIDEQLASWGITIED